MNQKIKKILCKDDVLSKLVQSIELRPIIQNKDILATLINSIINQQLSAKVAEIIFKRLVNYFEPQIERNSNTQQWNEPYQCPLFTKPQAIIDEQNDNLRALGLSYSKISYIKNVCTAHLQGQIDYEHLSTLTDEQVRNKLIQIKGVGNWTAEMIMMFSLGRNDIFPYDDIIIRNSIIKLYKIEIENKKELKQAVLDIASKWSPYRSHACFYLWKWVEG